MGAGHKPAPPRLIASERSAMRRTCPIRQICTGRIGRIGQVMNVLLAA
jgi:hypothetical protein